MARKDGWQGSRRTPIIHVLKSFPQSDSVSPVTSVFAAAHHMVVRVRKRLGSR